MLCEAGTVLIGVCLCVSLCVCLSVCPRKTTEETTDRKLLRPTKHNRQEFAVHKNEDINR